MNTCLIARMVAVSVCVLCGTTNATLFLSTSLGFSAHSEFDYLGSSTDQGSVCDEIINPSAESREIAGCPTQGTGWLTKFGRSTGFAGSVILGGNLRTVPNLWGLGNLIGEEFWKKFRGELEFSYYDLRVDQTQSIRSRTGVARDKLNNEIFLAQEYIGHLTVGSMFVNVRFNFRAEDKVQPYIGLGLFGLQTVSVSGGRVWARNGDWTQISTGSSLPNSEEVQRNLAGTASVAHETISEGSIAGQLFAGVDFPVNDKVQIGFRVHFRRLSIHATGGLTVLRSHTPPEGYSVRREIESVTVIGVHGMVSIRL